MTTPEIAARLADAFATIEEYRGRLPAEIDSILADAVCDTVIELTNHLQIHADPARMRAIVPSMLISAMECCGADDDDESQGDQPGEERHIN